MLWKRGQQSKCSAFPWYEPLRPVSRSVLVVCRILPYPGPMPAALRVKLTWIIAVAVAGCFEAGAQAPGVPLCSLAGQEPPYKARLLNATRDLYSKGDALKMDQARKQLTRTSCQLALPAASAKKLPARQICAAARHSHLRVGWTYLCDKCGKWHLNLSGGYALTSNGAVATCFHVVNPGLGMREGCLVAVDEAETVLPVVEVLAANRDSDACIVRVRGGHFKALPLNTNVYPGDAAYCYSDPAQHRDYFSAGIVNRFYQLSVTRPAGARFSPGGIPTRMNVSADWAPGSSGSAVLDDCGNAIGHVVSISTVRDEPTSKGQDSRDEGRAAIVFHEAVSARDVLLLTRQRK
jgi:hypothetical protein